MSRKITLARLLRNWTIVYAGKLVGAVSIVVMVYLAAWWQQGEDAVGAAALATAAGKTGRRSVFSPADPAKGGRKTC